MYMEETEERLCFIKNREELIIDMSSSPEKLTYKTKSFFGFFHIHMQSP